MNKQIIVVIVLCVLCVVVGVVMPCIDVAEALAPAGQALDNFLYHLNTIQ